MAKEFKRKICVSGAAETGHCGIDAVSPEEGESFDLDF